MANGPGYDATDVFVQARAALNDQAGETYTNANLVVWFQMAWEDLELELTVHDCPVAFRKTTLSVPAGTLVIDFTTTPALPSDFWMPIALEESQPGKNVWLPMRQRIFDQATSADNRPANITLWTWREGKLYFEGATEARDVALYYFGSLVEVDAASQDIGRIVPFSRGFLARKVAAFAYALQKGDLERAQIMQDEAVNFKDRMVSVMVKQNQNMPMRRKGYMGGRPRIRRMRMG
jgi:hypothetical protein